jgi:hypothetical protein
MSVDFSELSAGLDALAVAVTNVSTEFKSGAVAQLQAELDAEKAAHAADKALLDQANADIAAAQAAEVDAKTRLQSQTDALTALLSPAA